MAKVIFAAGEQEFHENDDADEDLVEDVEEEGERVVEVVAPERGGEREDRDERKEDEGGDDGAGMDFFEEIEEPVLDGPVTGGEDEGDGEAGPGGCLLQESVGELAGGDVQRDFEVQDEEGHDDGEDAVAEGLEPLLAEHEFNSAVAWKRCLSR